MNKKKTFGERLLRKREELKLTQEQLAAKIGITRVTISKIEQDLTQSTRADTLLSLAKVLKCTPQWLLNGSGSEDTSTNESNVVAGPPIYQFVPLVNWVQAGNWTDIAPQISFEDTELFPCPVKSAPGTFALRIQGDSMLPRFEEGDLIFVDPEKLDAENNKYIVAILEDSNRATFKQLQIIDEHKYLKALNPDYPPELKFLKINGNCKIIGTVIAHMKQV
ncbi:phage repressor protein [Photobacterium phosphoreum]|jgi:SOS-response transcriptional repressor LexA|uniref:LexA family protein n=1 Tax=Photobacterium phosphoreum TaxID=659 RepID=UPI000D16D742|nr:S24 family peptidase [Photobacterium phosphoreum]PSU66566.1 phage repressor protein [Photobacterium phosphoreum]PSW10707.1 phage repressor protein [Photobacterium phosphoreum]